MCHQAQKSFCGIFVGIPHHQKGYILYVPSTRNIIPSYDVVFDESFSTALEYMSQPYSETMAIRPSVTCTPGAMSPREQIDNILTLVQLEEGNILTKTCNDVESSDESDKNSIMP